MADHDASQIRLTAPVIQNMMDAGVWPNPPLPAPSTEHLVPLAFALAELAKVPDQRDLNYTITAIETFSTIIDEFIKATEGAKHAGECGTYIGQMVILALISYVDARKGGADEVTLLALLGGVISWLKLDSKCHDRIWWYGLDNDVKMDLALARTKALTAEEERYGDASQDAYRVRLWAFKFCLVVELIKLKALL